MKSQSFKQHNKKAALSFTTVYLIVIFLLLYFLFNTVDRASQRADNTINWSIAGGAAGVGIIVLYVIILQLFHDKLKVEINRYQMVVYTQGKHERLIKLEDISRMELNTNSINRLDIYDRQNRLLISFHPANEVRTTRNIIKELSGHLSFKLKKDTRVHVRTRIETLTYTRI